ncbi:MAG: hypothetical protein U5Q03_17460 [Bacteroidota bacterium]|nr:hypothetical protein [Bacteroidota bacterium]
MRDEVQEDEFFYKIISDKWHELKSGTNMFWKRPNPVYRKSGIFDYFEREEQRWK